VWDYVLEYANRVWHSTLINRLEWAIAIAVVFELLMWWTGRRLRRALQPVLQRDLHLDATERVLRRKTLLVLPLQVANGVLFLVAILVILRYLGFNTSAEVVPIALGLLALAAVAGWRNLQDAAAGYFLMYDDLFASGDRITIGELTGVVTAVGLRHTRLQGPDGREICLANREIRSVVNHTRTRDIQRKAQNV
jgi:MscS family membrane protein